MRAAVWLIALLFAILPARLHGAAPDASVKDQFSLALKADGTVLAWGDNTCGELGDGTTTPRSFPIRVGTLSGVTAVSAGSCFALALKGDGSVWQWGNITGAGALPSRVTSGFASISAGFSHALAIARDGSVWAWGSNSAGELGIGVAGASQSVPARVLGVANAVAVSAGANNSAALTSDGTVWTWGRNNTGQLGDGTTNDRSTPARVPALSGVHAIAHGRDHVLALMGNGTVRAWGGNVYGALGDGSTTTRLSPVVVNGLTGVAAISASDFVSGALKIDGTVWAWGNNAGGTLGDGTLVDRHVPVQVAGLSGISRISMGDKYAHAVGNDGSAWGWGASPYGVGDGTNSVRNRPVAIRGENGAGDLNLGAPATFQVSTAVVSRIHPQIPSDNIISVTANVTFPPEDVGKHVFLFGFAPSSVVPLAAKDGSCVLAQVTPSGFRSVTSSSGLTYATNVSSANQQSITLFDNVAGSQVAGSTLCLGVGETPTDATSPGRYTCPATLLNASGTACQPPATIDIPGAVRNIVAKTLGSRATVSSTTTLFGGFELSSPATIYILVRGNSLSTLGVTHNYLDAPRVRVYNSQGQDLFSDGSGPGFSGCTANAFSGAAVVNYYASVRGAPAHARDACTAQSLAAGAYTFTVTPSTAGMVSAPASGEVLFEVTLGAGNGVLTRTLGSRATVSPNATLFGGFEIGSDSSTVYILVRGNSLGALGVTQRYLDAPRVRIYDAGGRDLIFTQSTGQAGFNGCPSGMPEQLAVVNYYQNVRAAPAVARDACISQTLASGTYTFTVTPSIPGVTSYDALSAPSTGEVLFEVTLQ